MNKPLYYFAMSIISIVIFTMTAQLLVICSLALKSLFAGW